MLLGDGAVERGSIVVGRDGHVELGFRYDHFCRILNLKSNYVRFHARIVVMQSDARGLIVSWRCRAVEN